jgi:hypothetical protein
MPVFTELPRHQIEVLALRIALSSKVLPNGDSFFTAPKNIEIMEFLVKEDIQISKIKLLTNADILRVKQELQFLEGESIKKFGNKKITEKFFKDFGKAMVIQDEGKTLTDNCKKNLNLLIQKYRDEIKTIVLRLSVDFEILFWISKNSKENIQIKLKQLLESHPAPRKLEQRVLDELKELNDEDDFDFNRLIEHKDELVISALLQNESSRYFQIESLKINDSKFRIKIKNTPRIPTGEFKFQGAAFDFNEERIEVSFKGKRKVFRGGEKARMLRELFHNKNERVEISLLQKHFNKGTSKEAMDIMDRIKRDLKAILITKKIVDTVLPPAKDGFYQIITKPKG